jgi:hypothetical protein
MASSLFGNQSSPQRTSNGVQRINDIAGAAKKISGIVGLLKGKDANQVASALARINPQFAEFYNKNWNRPVEEIAADYGLNLDDVKDVLKML